MPQQPVPTRDTSEQQLDQWNRALRASPLYQQWMKTHGKVDTGRGVKLSDQEQEAFERFLAQNGIQIPSGMHIDQGGNLNQKNRLLRNVGIGAAIGGAALTGLGAAGMGPLSGLGGGAAASGAGAASASGGVLPSAAIPGLHTAVPAAIASGGASAAAPLGTVAAGAAGGVGQRLANMGGKALDHLTTPSGIASLAPMIAALASRGGSAGSGGGGFDQEFMQQAYQDAQRNKAMQEARFRRVDPLHEAVTQLAYSRLPTNMQNGPLPRVRLPE